MYGNGLVERRTTRYAGNMSGDKPWSIIRDKKDQPSEDEPKPEPEVEPDEDFTREDFMRDLRKFIPQENDGSTEDSAGR